MTHYNRVRERCGLRMFGVSRVRDRLRVLCLSVCFAYCTVYACVCSVDYKIKPQRCLIRHLIIPTAAAFGGRRAAPAASQALQRYYPSLEQQALAPPLRVPPPRELPLLSLPARPLLVHGRHSCHELRGFCDDQASDDQAAGVGDCLPTAPPHDDLARRSTR